MATRVRVCVKTTGIVANNKHREQEVYIEPGIAADPVGELTRRERQHEEVYGGGKFGAVITGRRI